MNKQKTITGKYAYKFKLTKVEESEILSTKITGSESANNYLKQVYANLDTYKENFVILGLNRNNEVIFHELISVGGLSGTVVDVRIIATFLLNTLSSSVVLCHNHPSGNLKPSINDDTITKQIRDALKPLDILLVDHLIVDDKGHYYSYADESKL